MVTKGSGPMLGREDNELLCRVGPGTPMGDLMRQYWVPAALSNELPLRDGAPLRVRLLGGQLFAFRGAPRRVRWGLAAPPPRPAPRRKPLLRAKRAGGPALRLSRLEVRRDRTLR